MNLIFFGFKNLNEGGINLGLIKNFFSVVILFVFGKKLRRLRNVMIVVIFVKYLLLLFFD